MKYTQRMKDLREDADLKQTAVAKEIGISQQYYSQYEMGKRELPIRHLIKLCQFYNVSADYILGFTDKKIQLPKNATKNIENLLSYQYLDF